MRYFNVISIISEFFRNNLFIETATKTVRKEFDIMIKYFRMKKKEIELKLTLYTYVSALINERKNVIDLVENIYKALKDIPAEELQDRLIKEIAELVHAEAEKD